MLQLLVFQPCGGPVHLPLALLPLRRRWPLGEELQASTADRAAPWGAWEAGSTRWGQPRHGRGAVLSARCPLCCLGLDYFFHLALHWQALLWSAVHLRAVA